MKKSNLFLTNVLMSAIRYGLIFILALIMTIIGVIWNDIFLYIGLGLLAIYLIICFASAVHMQKVIDDVSNSDLEFSELLERVSADPEAFIAEAMGNYEAKKQLHGEELLSLSDDDLFEAVYFQNLDIAENAETEDEALAQFEGARRTVYVLSLFDAEVQNGGLCQFFVNSTRAVAPYVSEALNIVGATEQRELFEHFIASNNIDVSNLESFAVSDRRGYIKQTKRFDFAAFDDKYCNLPALQDRIVEYIKANINLF